MGIVLRYPDEAIMGSMDDDDRRRDSDSPGPRPEGAVFTQPKVVSLLTPFVHLRWCMRAHMQHRKHALDINT